MTESIADAVEAELVRLSELLTEPGSRECLRCYLIRMLNEFGCNNTHRWTRQWRDSRAPRARSLIERLQRRGACCCDCEVIFNVFTDYPETSHPLPCAGVSRAGSTQPCDLRSRR
ncbi:MAG TPA: DUF2695 domain-containing protein [Streptosporangiaceae bacterium]